MPLPARLRRLAAGLALLAVSTLGALVLLEMVARVLHRPDPVRRVWDPYSYRVPTPGLVEQRVDSEGAPYEVRFNELGMRGPSPTDAVPPGTVTLVFLGGSTTENYALRDEDTFPHLVGRGVAARTGRPVRVFNAGMSGGNSATSLGRLQHQVIDLAPDLVVVLHAINDLLGGFAPEFRRDYRHLPRAATARDRPRSYLKSLLSARRVLSLAGPAPPIPATGGPELDPTEFPAFSVFRRNVRSIEAVGRAHAIPILWLTQPTLYGSEAGRPERLLTANQVLAGLAERPSAATLAAGMEAFNGVTRSLASDGASVFDLDAELPRDPELFVDDCHTTRRGNREIAERILPPVLRELERGTSAGAAASDRLPGPSEPP